MATTPEQKAKYAARRREKRADGEVAERERETARRSYRKHAAKRAAEQRAARAADPAKFLERDRARYGKRRRDQRNASTERQGDAARERSRARYAADPEPLKALAKAWRLAHPERTRAHGAVARALARGLLVRPEICAQCGRKCKPDAAHHDYSKPLEVTWLCRRCHMRMDKDPEKA